MGLYLPDSGRLSVDEVQINAKNLHAWRRSVAYLPQENFLFHATIRENLYWSNPDASDRELTTALQQAGAGFVTSLPEQLETVVGDAGVRLSGGERQRLALARALLRNPSLLILDEATSSLDRKNEDTILQAIKALHGKFTILLIAHSPYYLPLADQIVSLENGSIHIEKGLSQTLLTDGP